MRFLQIASYLIFIASPIVAEPAEPRTIKSSVAAQEWMHPMCCPDKDCRIAGVGEVVQTADGFTINDLQSVIGFDDVKLFPSQDNDTHICSVEIPPVEVPDGGDWVEIKCLYVPLGS